MCIYIYIFFLKITDSEKAIFADGSYKLIYGINGQYPGPSLVVYEGQQVIVYRSINERTKLFKLDLHITSDCPLLYFTKIL